MVRSALRQHHQHRVIVVHEHPSSRQPFLNRQLVRLMQLREALDIYHLHQSTLPCQRIHLSHAR